MSTDREPLQAADESRDLHEVATWEPASRSDRALAWLGANPLAVLVPGGLALLGLQAWLADFGAAGDPVVLGLAAASAVPALVLAWYVSRLDATAGLSRRALLAAAGLGAALAGFAGAATTLLAIPVQLGGRSLGAPRVVATTVLFFAVVAPVEEAVKLAAAGLAGTHTKGLGRVVDGAVYGAMAGLGFAVLENAFYVAGGLGGPLATPGTAAGFRALAAPGHVVFSAFAGYYLGLARFNRGYARALLSKGLLVAAGLHAAYNLGATVLPARLGDLAGLSPFAATLTFAVAFHGVAALALVRRISHYNAAYRETAADPAHRPRGTAGVALPDDAGTPGGGPASELTEFDP